MKTRFELYEIPDWALNYLINWDSTGLNDDELNEINAWMKRVGIAWACAPEDGAREHFTTCPTFGEPCMTIECYCAMLDE